MNSMKEYKSVKLSFQAYKQALQIRDSNPERYRSCGLVGVFDDLLLNRLTTEGKGKYARNGKKGVDIK